MPSSSDAVVETNTKRRKRRQPTREKGPKKRNAKREEEGTSEDVAGEKLPENQKPPPPPPSTEQDDDGQGKQQQDVAATDGTTSSTSNRPTMPGSTSRTTTPAPTGGSSSSRRGGDWGNQSSSYWCFTWNNPPDDYDELLKGMYDDDEKDLEYVVYGRETGESGTFHLQGFVQFGTPLLNSELANNGPAQRLFQAHWTKARRVEKARKYCMKDGDFTELGAFYMRQGKRTDIHDFQLACRAGGMTKKIAMENHPDVCAKYWQFVVRYIDMCRPKPTLPEYPFFPWQKVLKHHLQNDEPDPRQIVFCVDTVGNMGKSWFCLRMLTELSPRVQYITPSKVENMSYAMAEDDIDIMLVDCPRSRQELFQYDFVEYVKNGVVFSTKYESRLKFYKPCHVVVMMNQYPDYDKLSRDRFLVITLDDALGRSPTPETEKLETWEQFLEYRRTHTGAGLPGLESGCVTDTYAYARNFFP